ncbi:hypothetical protein DXG03_002130 [Asterophora parasitica]|uniref:F-box domain-containing protein n=1 Tax=Asterophora parasitica TaxID=117018 RepID=A0A9P7G4Q5_9AGAR|nr:hypothetical protein DXG03_002130 [Asterophora parasitica]
MDVAKDCISTSKDKISTLEEKQISREQDNSLVVEESHTAVALWHHGLPRELISEIFVQTLSGGPFLVPPNANSSPWNLRAVCASWRRIALAERRLWSHLEVTRAEASGWSVEESFFKFLSQHVIHPNGPVSFNAKELIYLGSWQVFIEDVVRPNLQRIHTLDICARLSHLSDIAPHSCPQLDTLSLDIWGEEAFTMCDVSELPFFTGMSALRTLTIIGIVLERQLSDPSTTTLPWGQLTSLTISLRADYTADLLSRCSSLLSCSLSFNHAGIAPDTFAPVTAPRIRCIVLKNPPWATAPNTHGVLDSLTLPSLSELDITCVCLGRRYCETINGLLRRSGCALTVLDMSEMRTSAAAAASAGLDVQLLHPSIRELYTNVSYPLHTLERIEKGELCPRLAAFRFCGTKALFDVERALSKRLKVVLGSRRGRDLSRHRVGIIDYRNLE